MKLVLKVFIRYVILHAALFVLCTFDGHAQNIADTIPNKSSVEPDTVLLAPDSTLNTNIPTKKKKPAGMLNDKVDYQAADTIESYVKEKRIILKENAKVVFGDIELTASFIDINFDKSEIFARGRTDSLGNTIGYPIFKEGDQVFESKEIRYNFKTEKGIITDVITEQDGGYLHSKRTKKHNDNIIDLKAGKYTTCDHEHPHYYIAMTKARVIQDDKIVSGPLYLVISDIPTPLAIPFGFFPFTREKTSGLILPSYGESELRGFALEGLGYYWAINDYFDLKVMGSIYSKGSMKGSIASRYKKRYKFGGEIKLELEKIVEGDRGTSDEEKTKAYSFIWSHRQDPKSHPNSSFQADVNLRNSETNRYSTNPDQHIQNTVNSSINYSNNLVGTPFSFNAQLRHTLNIIDSSATMTFPSMNVNMKRISPFESLKFTKKPNIINKIGITYRSKFENRFTVHEDDLFKQEVVEQFKYGVKHDIDISSTAKFLKFFNFSPSANYSERWYFNSIRKKQDNSIFENEPEQYTNGRLTVDTITGFNRVYDYNIGASVNTTIYGLFSFQPYMPIEAIRFVHTPSIGYSYKPDFTTDKYGYYGTIEGAENKTYSYYENGIYGTPSGGKSGSITLSLSNQIGMKIRTPKDTVNSTKKIDLLKQLSFNTSYNLAVDSMNWAPLSMRASTNLFKRINITGGAILNPYALDPKTYNPINNYQFKVDGKLGRLTNANFDVSFTIDSKIFEGDEVKDDKQDNTQDYYDYFDIPWSFNIDYKYSYSKPRNEKRQLQTIGISGNFSVTPKWKVSVSTRYDIESRQMATARFDVVRDLHCWVATFSWVPFGRMQSYSFTIGVKASILQDLKWDKKENWYDRNY